MNYSKELKDSILRRLLPPNSESVSKVAKEEGLPEQTIRTWLSKACKLRHRPDSFAEQNGRGAKRADSLTF